MNTVIIMAQGQQTRLPSLDQPKQKLTIDEVLYSGRVYRPISILHRIINQVVERGPHPFVIGPQELELETYQKGLVYTLVDPGECILSGILASQLLFGEERTVILLGDVVYSNAAMERVLSCDLPLFFAGTETISPSEGEIFAFGFSRSVQRQVTEALRKSPCLDHQGAHVDYKGQPGHLRQLIRTLRNNGAVVDYLVIDDWTNDIDTEEDLRLLLPELRQRVAEENVADGRHLTSDRSL